MREKTQERALAKAFAEFAAEFPVAKGSLTKTHCPCVRKGCRLCAEGAGHPKLIFTFRESGKLRGLYVRPAHEAALRAAIENGRYNGNQLFLSSHRRFVGEVGSLTTETETTCKQTSARPAF